MVKLLLRKRSIAFLLSAILFASPLQAQDDSAYKKEGFITRDDTLLYRILWPNKFDESQKYPVVLFLHGAGERGNDNNKQLTHGSELFLNHHSDHPSIVIFPQCPTRDYWSNVNVKTDNKGKRTFSFVAGGDPTRSMQEVMDLMDSVSSLPFVDKDRIYVIGLSMGGMGTFEIISRKPGMFAAAVPICGGGNPATAKNFASKVNLWVFHGAKDDIVPSAHSEQMVKAIKNKGGNVKFMLYPNANHNSWDSAFAEKGLIPWLFSQKKEAK